MFLVLVFFSGFRYDAGNDFFSYLELALGHKVIDGLELIPSMLIEFSIQEGSPVFFFLISSLIYVSCMFVGLKKFGELNYITVSFFVFFVLSYLTSFGYVRQYMAIGLTFLSLSFLYTSSYFWSALFLSLGVLCHLSALVVALVFFVRPIFFRVYHPVIYFCLIATSYLFFDSIIHYGSSYTGLYVNYFEVVGQPYGKKIFLVLVCCFFYCLAFGRYFNVRDDRLFAFSLNCSFLGLILYSALLSYGEYLVRVSYYFVPFFYILFSRMYKICKYKAFQLIVILVLLSSSFLSTIYFAY